MRCAAFLPDELSDSALEQVISEGINAGDPLLPLMTEWARATEEGDLQVMRRVWRRVVDAGDPALVEWAITSGGDFMQAISDMDPSADERSRLAYLQVWGAVACELGAGCVVPRGPPDAMCELLPRCARERWGVDALVVDPSNPMALAVSEVRRALARLQGHP